MSGFVAACRTLGRDIAVSLRGITQLTFGRAEGIRVFENDREMASRSFIAALFSFPIFLLFRYLDWLSGAVPAEGAHALALDLLSFPISWAGFALLSLPLLRSLGLEAAWSRYLVAWNWCNFAQYILLLVSSLPLALHAPSIFAQTSALVGYGWALWLEWYVTRLVLNTTPLTAAVIVAADVAFGALVALMPALPLPHLSF
jgi:hypothetical protein